MKTIVFKRIASIALLHINQLKTHFKLIMAFLRRHLVFSVSVFTCLLCLVSELLLFQRTKKGPDDPAFWYPDDSTVITRDMTGDMNEKAETGEMNEKGEKGEGGEGQEASSRQSNQTVLPNCRDLMLSNNYVKCSLARV
jgi:hypothetical protein